MTLTDTSRLMLIGLGSNLGDSVNLLARAVTQLRECFGELQVASLYRSAPISTIPQPDYLNSAAIAPLPTRDRGRLGRARECLDILKAIERRAGRSSGPRFGPRPLDLDLLTFGELLSDEEDLEIGGAWLTLPHPRLRQRRFVLEPLAELCPNLPLPPDGARVEDLLRALGDHQSIARLPPSASWPRHPAQNP